ncbi:MULTISPECIES: DUF262 domain-containing protein [Stenotrophomonas]|uniref:GmrSD restriction endonuclease domain-containing protein n=1 Tax=Stenotrophomonas TaxID=40323 RepID=UPI001CF18459|nr:MULTISPECIES: DUF262 domain-containing protein [Stenotrophomonas]MCA7023371.1 DUF262 domain-containing protein [Stenotrophomonas acidaminiphila]MCE4076398.1 DUF262 domain-containing protein [Stenotrophomonas acidaminiphila]
MAELASQPTSIQSAYGWYSNDKLIVNRRYQRKLVWTLEEKQRLIESILKKYPIPAVLVAERDGALGSYEIIDGLQRLHAIFSFIECSFPTLDGRYFDVQHFPTAKAGADAGKFDPNTDAKKISQDEVGVILDYNLALSVMRGATEHEVNDVFGRINTYGHRLSDQERRQAGVQNSFSNMVRSIACTIRGDESAGIINLGKMPSISIDLPMTRHGYDVQADEVFWVRQGILRSTELRDSLDEQCIADLAACIVGGQLIERSKDALDSIYEVGTEESARIENALEVYGEDKFSQELKYCLDEILGICGCNGDEKLRDILFSKRNTNSFPAVFAAIFIAVHELIVKDGMRLSDYAAARKAIDGLHDRIETSRKATSPDERRKNIDTIKGLLAGAFVKDPSLSKRIYNNHAITDIESTIRRSEIETPSYELKQGMLTLAPKGRDVDANVVEKVIKTICAIANNGKGQSGTILIGVTDKDADSVQVAKLDGIKPNKVGRRYVVGVDREAKVLGISVEQYFSRWKDAVKNSSLSEPLKTSVLSSFDYNSYYGLGVIVISIPPQAEISYLNNEVYWRNGDSTELAATPVQIAGIAKRF